MVAKHYVCDLAISISFLVPFYYIILQYLYYIGHTSDSHKHHTLLLEHLIYDNTHLNLNFPPFHAKALLLQPLQLNSLAYISLICIALFKAN